MKFFNLLESTCKILDIKYNALKEDQDEENLLAVYSEICDLEKSIEKNQGTIEMIHEAAAIAISKEPENEKNIMAIFKPRIDFYQNTLKNKVCRVFFKFLCCELIINICAKFNQAYCCS